MPEPFFQKYQVQVWSPSFMPTWVGSPYIFRRSAFVVTPFLISAPGFGDGKSRPVVSAAHAASETANARTVVSAARRCRIAGLLF